MARRRPLNPRTPEAMALLAQARAAESRGHLREAAEAYIQLNAYDHAAVCYEDAREWASAADCYTRAKDYGSAGKCYEFAGLWARAAGVYELAGWAYRNNAEECLQRTCGGMKATAKAPIDKPPPAAEETVETKLVAHLAAGRYSALTRLLTTLRKEDFRRAAALEAKWEQEAISAGKSVFAAARWRALGRLTQARAMYEACHAWEEAEACLDAGMGRDDLINFYLRATKAPGMSASRAGRFLARLGELYEDRAEMRAQAAECYQRAGEALGAKDGRGRELLRQAAGLHSADGHTTQARRCLEAARLFTEAAQLAEKDGDLVAAASLYTQGGADDDAVRCYGQLGLTKDIALMWEMRKQWKSAAMIWEGVADWARAATNFERAGLLDRAALSYEKAGRWKAAQQCYERLRRYDDAARCKRAMGGSVVDLDEVSVSQPQSPCPCNGLNENCSMCMGTGVLD